MSNAKDPGMTEPEEALGFAAEHDTPIPYMARIRSYYLALGYENPYRWAHYASVPFTAPPKPLDRSRIALVTTAAPFQPDKGDQGPGAAYNASAKFYAVYSGDSAVAPDLRISHVGYDRLHTTAEDMNSYIPLARLHAAAEQGRIGGVAPRYHGAPTNRSQITTIERDCTEILTRIREDEADAAILVAN
jgi:hypothetical protein